MLLFSATSIESSIFNTLLVWSIQVCVNTMPSRKDINSILRESADSAPKSIAFGAHHSTLRTSLKSGKHSRQQPILTSARPRCPSPDSVQRGCRNTQIDRSYSPNWAGMSKVKGLWQCNGKKTQWAIFFKDCEEKARNSRVLVLAFSSAFSSKNIKWHNWIWHCWNRTETMTHSCWTVNILVGLTSWSL